LMFIIIKLDKVNYGIFYSISSHYLSLLAHQQL